MLKLFKAKSLKDNTKTRENAGAGVRGAGEQGAKLTSSFNERTREKAILKEGIGVNGKTFVSKRAGTRGFSFATHTPSKIGFSVCGSKKQRGRSMVEMLGVLAIIGVLSIGGISGYTIAMRRYRANEIINLMNKYATILYSACQTKMMNDPANYPSLYSCNPGWSEAPAEADIIKFTDVGLGPLPNGVLLVIANEDWGIEYDTYFYYTAVSHDMVEVGLVLDDKALCDVLADMSNEADRKNSGAAGTVCKKETNNNITGYRTHLTFYVS